MGRVGCVREADQGCHRMVFGEILAVGAVREPA